MQFTFNIDRFKSTSRIHELSAFFKGFLFITAILLILAFLIYNQYVVHRLRENERRLLHVYANLYAAATSELTAGEELNLIFDEVIRPTDFPIIATTVDGEPYAWKGIGVDPENRNEKNLARVQRILKNMDKRTEPVPLSVGETEQIVGYLHYGDSGLVKQLSRMPYLQVAVVGLFIFIGFLGYRNIKKSEQRFIWIGMAKETAHQLGTPISSLMGWLELLRTRGDKEQAEGQKLEEILEEIERDLKRLSKVVSRFSQIGSEPHLEKQSITPILSDTAHYFRQRLPQLSKRIDIAEHYSEIPPLLVNKELLEWVFENLFKNSIDAIGNDGGRIEIRTSLEQDEKYVAIHFTDSGRGIEPKAQHRIFSAGYSTKKRGWGLGLTLAKRIIEEYHGGRILLKESDPGQGTTFLITLPIKE